MPREGRYLVTAKSRRYLPPEHNLQNHLWAIAAGLVLGVCLVYVWLIRLGAWVVKNGLRQWVDRKDRRDKSYFRLGWDWLERCLAQGLSLKLRFVPH
jgi:hypothetical protein